MQPKLTIEKICPYLPYGLQVSYFDAERVLNQICTIELVHLPDELTIVNSEYQYEVAIDEIKLLLIPLSELTTYAPYLKEFGEPDVFLDYNGEWAMDFTVGGPTISWPLQSTQEYLNGLYKYHFDVFDLIDSGLALNKLEVGR